MFRRPGLCTWMKLLACAAVAAGLAASCGKKRGEVGKKTYDAAKLAVGNAEFLLGEERFDKALAQLDRAQRCLDSLETLPGVSDKYVRLREPLRLEIERVRTRVEEAQRAEKRAAATVQPAPRPTFATPKPRRKRAPKPAAARREAEAVPEHPVTVTAVKAQGKFALCSLIFAAKGRSAIIGSVTGDFVDAGGKAVDPIRMVFLEEGFKANWDEIYESAGTAVAAGQVSLAEGQTVKLVGVGDTASADKIVGAKVSVATHDGREFRAAGPKR